jgi:hypothetical protein
VPNATQGQLADVHHALDAAQIDEGAEVLHAGDGPVHDRTFDQLLAGLSRARVLLLLQQCAARDNHVRSPTALELGDAKGIALADQGRQVFDEAESTCEAGQKARWPEICTSTPPLMVPVIWPSTGRPC